MSIGGGGRGFNPQPTPNLTQAGQSLIGGPGGSARETSKTRERTLTLEFPIAGMDTRIAFDKQAERRPFTSPRMSNVRAIDPLGNRLRGGSRSDLIKAMPTDLGSDINLLNVVRSTGAPVTATFADPLDAATVWDAASWTSGLPAFSGVATGTIAAVKGAVLKSGSVPSIESGEKRTIELQCTLGDANSEIFVYANMDNTTPIDTASVAASVVVTGQQSDGTQGLSLRLYVDGVNVKAHPLGATNISPGWLTLTVEYGKISANYQVGGVQLGTSLVYSGLGSAAGVGDNAGFVLDDSSSTVASIVDFFGIIYTTASQQPREFLIAAANGTLYSETVAGAMTAVASTLPLESAYPLQGVSRLSKTYIADWALPRQEKATASTNATMSAGVLDDSDVADWTLLGISATQDVVEVTSITNAGANDLVAGWYKISVIHATNGLTLVNLDGTTLSTAADDVDTSCAYRVVPALKVYDGASDSLTIWTATAGRGSVPYGCRLIDIYFDRIILSGDPRNPGTVYMARIGDPDDWLEVSTETESAVFMGSTDGFTQTVPAPVTALMPMMRDHLIVATSQDGVVLKGDLRLSGIIDRVMARSGAINGFAHTVTDRGELLFLSRYGLMRFSTATAAAMISGDIEEVERISQERVPQELLNIDVDLNSVSLEYDPVEFGVYIWISPLTQAGKASAWFVDLRTGAFLPDEYATDHQPMVSTYYGRTNQTIIGSRDGFLRTFAKAATGDDDGVARTQLVDIGPIPLSGKNTAMVETVETVLSEDSDNVSWNFRVGQSPEEAQVATPKASGTFVAGVNRLQRVKNYGNFGFLRLFTTVAANWAVESIKLHTVQFPARQRRT